MVGASGANARESHQFLSGESIAAANGEKDPAGRFGIPAFQSSARAAAFSGRRRHRPLHRRLENCSVRSPAGQMSDHVVEFLGDEFNRAADQSDGSIAQDFRVAAEESEEFRELPQTDFLPPRSPFTGSPQTFRRRLSSLTQTSLPPRRGRAATRLSTAASPRGRADSAQRAANTPATAFVSAKMSEFPSFRVNSNPRRERYRWFGGDM